MQRNWRGDIDDPKSRTSKRPLTLGYLVDRNRAKAGAYETQVPIEGYGRQNRGPVEQGFVGFEVHVARTAGIPDMRFINREVAIAEVARALDLRLDGDSKIHCWYPERHQHGDRTASVGIRHTNNTVKCFGCDSRPMGPIDLVMDVLAMASALAKSNPLLLF